MKPFHALLMIESAIVAVGVVSYVLLFPSASSTEPVVPVTQTSAIATPVATTTRFAHADSSNVDRFHGDTLALRHDITRLSSEVTSLKRQLQTLSERMSAMSLRTADQALLSVNAPDEELLEDDLSRDERLAQETQQHQQWMAFIETDFQTEHVDSRWSTVTTELIEQSLSVEELAGTAVFDVECRSNLCRLEIQHDDPMAQMEFEAQLPMAVGEALPRITMDQSEDEDGLPGLTVVYLARDDYQFPQLEGG